MPSVAIPILHAHGHRGVIGNMTVSIDPGENTLTVDDWPESSVVALRETLLLAVRSAGMEFPQGRVTVCSSLKWPAHPHNLDLPAAVALLAASAQIPRQALQDLYVGRLNADGRTGHSTGIFPMLQEAARRQYRRAAVPVHDTAEALHSPLPEILPVHSLKQLTDHLTGVALIQPAALLPRDRTKDGQPPVYVDMTWQSAGSAVQRVLEVAAAGRHHVFLTGPPGSGRTLFGRLLPWLMPPLDAAELEQNLALISMADRLSPGGKGDTTRPLRAPHFTISTAGLLGNGRRMIPGDVSLAHRGVLLIDDATQFHRQQLEMLVHTMDHGSVSLSRLADEYQYPADFTLVLSATPCPCGYAADPDKVCVCNPHSANRHRRSIPDALSGRVHIGVNLPIPSPDEPSAPFAEARDRVAGAWMRRRQWKSSGWNMIPDAPAEALLAAATRNGSLPPSRAGAAVSVGATIAHLLELDAITPACMAEALQISANPWRSHLPPRVHSAPIRDQSPRAPSHQAPLNI